MSLLKKTAQLSNLRNAWRGIKHRPDSRGFDEITIEEFEDNLSRELKKVRAELLSGKYKFTPLKGVAIPKEGKTKEGKPKYRPLKVPAIRDRVVQKAIELTITPHIKKAYKIDNAASYAYIRGRSVEDAVLKVKSLQQKGYGWIYLADIERFFDTVDIDILLKKFVYPQLPDKTLHSLIREALTVEVGNGAALKAAGLYDEFPAAGSGIPQGGTLSPLFANVYLNGLDLKMIEGGYQLVRYADDFVVLCKKEEEAEKADKLAREIVEKNLGLKIHPTKKSLPAGNDKCSSIVPATNFDFIGIRFRGPHLYPGSKQFAKMITKLKVQSRPSTDMRLVDKLDYIKMRTESWGANYHYTDFDRALYASLDSHLSTSLNQIMLNCGYKLIAKQDPQKTINQLGLMTFTQSLNYYKTKIADRRTTKKNDKNKND